MGTLIGIEGVFYLGTVGFFNFFVDGEVVVYVFNCVGGV